MPIDEDVLRNEERISLLLRKIYAAAGYTRYKMSKFEEYDLYMENKDFLISDGIITFTDTSGKLLALKPDVTLSIIKNTTDAPGAVQKVYYNENVYRISGSSRSYKEIMQTGLECVGDISDKDVREVLKLALQSLKTIGGQTCLSLCHVGLLSSLLNDYGIKDDLKQHAIRAVISKNSGELAAVCGSEVCKILKPLYKPFATPEDALSALYGICKSSQSKAASSELAKLCSEFADEEYKSMLNIDFSIASLSGYYSGVIFKGYLRGVESAVLSGGQYDMLLRKMNRNAKAIGFAVYLDALERLDGRTEARQGRDIINIALPKGRLGEQVYEKFEAAGFDCPSIRENNRRLIFENERAGVRFFWVKPSDVAIYVERGAADIGVAGKDILLEYKPDVYELLDLNIGKCRMAVAAPKGFKDDTGKTLRVASKFTNIAKSHYAEKCRDIDIIHLNGSIELAPILGLSDVIVDIVETGKTLLENDLEPIETIIPISARLIANKSSYQFKTQMIEGIKKGLKDRVQQEL